MTEQLQLLTLAEAAKRLCISPRTLWGLTRAGEIPSVTIGRRNVRYDVEDLRAYILKRKSNYGVHQQSA